MEENEDKKPEGNEGETPSESGGAPNTPEERKDEGSFKAKVGAFFSVKRNKIIVGACSTAAVVALIVGLSVGLTQCSNGDHGNAFSSNSNSEGKSSSDGGSSSSDGKSSGDGSSSSKGGESSSSHTHDYGTAWKSDATKHWHECACGERSGVADHTFSTEKVVVTKATPTASGTKGYQCTVCEYAKDTEAYTPYVTSDNFASATKLEGDKFTVSIAENKEDGSSAKRVKNGTAVHLTQSSGSTSVQDAYYTVEGTGSETKYYSYAKDSSGAWIKSVDADKKYDGYSTYDVIKEAFDSKLTYSDLTFDETKGCYTATYTNNVGTSVSAELYFDNGKITKAMKSFSEGSSFTYTFSDEAEAITLPEAHMHTFSGAGILDLNSENADFKVTCSDCGKTATKERLEADEIGSVLYGYYPQTHVSDETTINSLKDLTAESSGWYKLGDTYYAKATAGSASAKFDDGTSIASGTEYWFRCDPIEWKVLSNSNGTCSLVSNLLLDTHSFNTWWSGANATTGRYASNYQYSELRSWLTGEFFNKAFASGSSRIQTVTVDNSVSTINSENPDLVCENTDDKIYLLSYKDYFSSQGYFSSNLERVAVASDYVRASGAVVSDVNNAGQYWTRSPNGAQTYGDGAMGVTAAGGVWMDMVSAKNCIRPAITVKLPVASDHQHTDPTSGVLDLNNGGTKFLGKCPVCDAQVTCDYDSSKQTITGFYYGYYPQTHVSDETTLNSLKDLTPESNGWYKLGDAYYAKLAGNPCGINSTQKFDDGDSIVKDSDYWFSCDPIEWNVISSSDKTYSLISTLLLDRHRFGDQNTYTGQYPNNYKESEIRSWLTGDFFNKAFPSDDALIQTIEVDNSAATTDEDPNPHACDNTNDKVYLLSYSQFADDPYFNDSDNLKAKTTDYARANGAFSCADADVLNNGTYWTRSPLADTTYDTYVLDVDADGYLSQSYCSAKTHSVRPGITIKLS